MANEMNGRITEVSIDKINFQDPKPWNGGQIYGVGIQIEGEWHNTSAFKEWDVSKLKETLILDRNIKLYFFDQQGGNGNFKKFRIPTRVDFLEQEVLKQALQIKNINEQLKLIVEEMFPNSDTNDDDHRPEPEEEIKENIEVKKPAPIVDERDDLPF